MDTMKRQLLKLFGLAALSGCAQAQTKSRSVSTVVLNYTDRYIDRVFVDGVFAGIADAYGGEGSRVQGLLAPSDPNRIVMLKVKWIVADTYDVEKNKYSDMPNERHEASVELAHPYPLNPSYLVLHFYPDGHVEAELEAGRVNWRIPRPAGYHR
ncbi:MAG: DUF3304 domain-containing protein [Undibacterium sp.]|uniref:DUF3304 domain-containing protein n=1 Tax=Undibacterium sp. TaxID=1914977 RepID=UPI002718E957|nr:DUF3304 domain-containing protein [Undibacterium sp.]MDO8650695.1 DUF3304 domain-containing protein [Undibacterium sp.]